MGNSILPSRQSRALIVLLALSVACTTTAPTRISEVPDPLAPPLTAPPLSAAAATAVRTAVAAAERGDFARARKGLETLPATHPACALAALETEFLQGVDVKREALDLAKAEGGYGSAWGFAAMAAQRAGDLRGAWKAARRAAELQPDAQWTDLASSLAMQLASGLVTEGSALLARGDASGALAKARAALASVPDAAPARILAVQALLTLQDVGGAAAMVPGLPDSPEGLTLKGRVAEALGQWDIALELYDRLPRGDPNRCELIESAREHWRLANAPPYLVQALAAQPLHRRQLAAILMFEAPTLADEVAGPAPVFEDVVQLPERIDILAVARAGVLAGDPLARRFHPERTVSPHDLEVALDRVASVLHRPRPHWCEPDQSDCLRLPQVVDGNQTATLVRLVADAGGEPCARH
jgi:tetratricopeptide (TPR) repeat protein